MTAITDTTPHGRLLLSAVMPSVLNDIDKILNNKEILFSCLPIKDIHIIAPENVKERIDLANDSRLIFINENEFADTQRIRALYLSRTDEKPGRAGWYIQQFIKMQFARCTGDEYYLVWDSDTIPLKHIDMFDDASSPYFDMKTEYHTPYFDTISRLLPGIHKTAKGSFISEHMIIRSEYMREMLDVIESNAGIEGRDFQEKIINAAGVYDLPRSGFSEYETFGSYVMLRHPGSYILREWHSLRDAGRYYRGTIMIGSVNG